MREKIPVMFDDTT